MHIPAPVRIFSKTLPATRAARLRAAWFVLGIAFGIGCSSSLSPIIPSQQIANIPLDPVNEPEIPAVAAVMDSTIQAPEQAAQAEATPDVPDLAPIVIAKAQATSYPLSQTLVVANGDNFVTLLGKAGVGMTEAHAILNTMGKKFNPRSLSVNDRVNVTLDKKEKDTSPYLTKLSLEASPTKTLEISRTSKGDYKVAEINAPIEKKLARAGGKIESSLYATMTSSGLPFSMMNEIIKAYSYDVDFQREIHPGDKIDVVFERMQTESGVPVGFGKIIYASLDLGDRDLRIYRYTDKSGASDYYNNKGESVRKALLRTPINSARITSGFGLRTHPILGYSKMHKGVDFAAPTGTPVYASGDGVVNFVGRKGGYGNYLQIKHNTQYSSSYAHLSRFASGVAPGKKVKQGQIVAYVGTTGMSTGPHLHYEIHANNIQVNPANVKFKTGTVLAGKELASFKRERETLQAQLNAMGKPSGKIAMLDMPAKKLAN